MQTLLNWLVLEALFQNIRIGDKRFKAEFFLNFVWRDGLEDRVYDWEQERGFDCFALSSEFSDSCKQVFFFYFKRQ